MRSVTTNRLTLVTVSAGLIVLGAGAYLARATLLEQWYLRRLSSEDTDVRVHAAERLAEMRSLSAASRLVEWIRRDEREFGHYRVDHAGSNRPATRVGLTPLCMALYRIGPAARPAVRAARMTPRAYEQTQEWREWRADDALRAVEKAWAFPQVGVRAIDYPSPTEGVEP